MNEKQLEEQREKLHLHPLNLQKTELIMGEQIKIPPFFHYCLSQLLYPLKQTFFMYYGISKEKPMQVREISSIIGYRPNYIYQLMHRATMKLYHPKRFGLMIQFDFDFQEFLFKLKLLRRKTLGKPRVNKLLEKGWIENLEKLTNAIKDKKNEKEEIK